MVVNVKLVNVTNLIDIYIILSVLILLLPFAFLMYLIVSNGPTMDWISYDSKVRLNTNINTDPGSTNVYIIKFQEFLRGYLTIPISSFMKNNIIIIAHLYENDDDRNKILLEARKKYKSLSRKKKKIAQKEFYANITYTKDGPDLKTTLLYFSIKNDIVYLQEFSEQVAIRNSKLMKI